MNDVQPRAIGKLTVLRHLGSGAMGDVYLCVQPELEREVAVKVMRGGREQWPRFQREARSAARLVHPHAVRVYDVGLDHDRPYIVMEFVDGRPLSELIGSGDLTVRVSLVVLYHVASALEAAHQQGIIHRDVKPSNILIDSAGRPRLTDFGLAKCVLQDSALSASGELIGTPRYMAPEQILNGHETLDHRTDIFSLGVVMYEMLAGRPPFEGSSVVHTLRQITDDDPPDLAATNREIPDGVRAVCIKALAKSPDERYSSAAQFAEALRSLLLSESDDATGEFNSPGGISRFVPISAPGSKPPRTGRRIATALAVACGLCAAGIVMAISRRQDRGQEVSQAVEVDAAQFARMRSKLLQDVEEVRNGRLRVQENATPRDVLKAGLDDATSLSRIAPSDVDVRLARVRLLRRAGECLAADAECSAILDRQPNLDAARVERALARFQLFGLYLGAWSDSVLRYPAGSLLSEDVSRLATSKDPRLALVAQLLSRLSAKPGDDVLALATVVPPPKSDSVSKSDILSLQAELLYRAAETADVNYVDLASAARRQLRVGLEEDPFHIPLLFIRAVSFTRRVGWDTGEGDDDRDAALKRSLPQFESAMERFRRTTLRQGCDSSAARAVIFMNRGWTSPAMDQLQDALSCRPTVPHLHAVSAWLKIHSPEDGTHTAESLAKISRDLESAAIEHAGDQTTSLFIQAMLDAGAGQFKDARRDLKRCRRTLGESSSWPEIDYSHQEWLAAADGNETAFLYATRAILSQIPIGTDVTLKLHEALLTRLEDSATTDAEQIPSDQLREMRAWTRFSLAEVHAGRENPDETLAQIRLSLEQRSPEITGETCREHWAFSAWKDDERFRGLYEEFPAPKAEEDAEASADASSPQESPSDSG
jgi:predicted Ser/Thr protein kinase